SEHQERSTVSHRLIGHPVSRDPGICTVAAPLRPAECTAAREPTGISMLIAHCDPLISAGLSATLREQRFTVAVEAPPVDESRADDLFFPTDVVVADYAAGLHLLRSRELWRERILIGTDRGSQSSICHALEQGAGAFLLLGCGVAALVGAIRSVHGGR